MDEREDLNEAENAESALIANAEETEKTADKTIVKQKENTDESAEDKKYLKSTR